MEPENEIGKPRKRADNQYSKHLQCFQSVCNFKLNTK